MKNNIKKPLLISALLIFILTYGQNDTNEVVVVNQLGRLKMRQNTKKTSKIKELDNAALQYLHQSNSNLIL